MKRFLPPNELARDSRFKRAGSRNQLVPSLPDDVDQVVAVLEAVAPKIRQRVEGTALEQMYDELGPGFAFLMNAVQPKPGSPDAEKQLRLRLHGIYVGELQALEAAGRTLWDFPEAPWEFKLNMARQCWDETRHVQIYEKLLERAGGAVGEYPENTFLFEASCHDDPVLRVTGVNRCLEGLACDVFRQLIDFGKTTGDEVLAQAVDFVLADELTHVRFGSDWVREWTRGDPERDRRFTFGGARNIAREERLEAGFSEAELDELSATQGGGPRRETLVRAAEIARERHLARRAAES